MVMYQVKYTTLLAPLGKVDKEGEFPIVWCRPVLYDGAEGYAPGTYFPVAVAFDGSASRDDARRFVSRRLADLCIAEIARPASGDWQPPLGLTATVAQWRTTYEQQRLAPDVARYPVNHWHHRALQSVAKALDGTEFTVFGECSLRAFVNLEPAESLAIVAAVAKQHAFQGEVEALHRSILERTNSDCLVCSKPPYSLPVVAIEVDGPHHDEPHQKLKDDAKDNLLSAAGVATVRVRLRRDNDKRAAVADDCVGKAVRRLVEIMVSEPAFGLLIESKQRELIEALKSTHALESLELASLLRVLTSRARRLEMRIDALEADLQAAITERTSVSFETEDSDAKSDWYLGGPDVLRIAEEILDHPGASTTDLMMAAGMRVTALCTAADSAGLRYWVDVEPRDVLNPPPFETRVASISSTDERFQNLFEQHLENELRRRAFSWLKGRSEAIREHGRKTLYARLGPPAEPGRRL